MEKEIISKSKLKTLEIKGKASITCGVVEINDANRPFSTQVLIDGKPLADLGVLRSFKYEVTVCKSYKSHMEPGEAKLTIKYYPKSVLVDKDDEKEKL